MYVNVVPFRILFSLCEDNIGASKTLMTFMLFILITCKLCTGGMIIRTTKPKKPKKGKYQWCILTLILASTTCTNTGFLSYFWSQAYTSI